MNRLIRNIFLSDRTTLLLSGLAVAAVIFFSVISLYTERQDKANDQLRSRLQEMQSLRDEAAAVKDIVSSREKKIGLTKTGGIVPALEGILRSLGMKAQVMKPLQKAKIREFTEEDAELEIQGTDLNSIVNLLFRIDTSPAPMKIKNASVRTSFEDPDKFILRLTVSLISKG